MQRTHERPNLRIFYNILKNKRKVGAIVREMSGLFTCSPKVSACKECPKFTLNTRISRANARNSAQNELKKSKNEQNKGKTVENRVDLCDFHVERPEKQPPRISRKTRNGQLCKNKEKVGGKEAL